MPTISLPRQLARTELFSLGAPGHFTIAEDEMTVLFLRSRAGDDPVGCLWAVQAGSGPERLLADPAELLGATHDVRDETIFENLHWHQVRFLQRHLGVTPRGPATGLGSPAAPAASP